jgi:hypothetical protein
VGGERSIAKTIENLKANILEPNRPVLFFACETETPDTLLQRFDGFEIGGSVLLPSFRTSEYSHILSMCLERPGTSEAVFRRAREADGLAWDSSYLINGGTILQYYQLWKAWGLLLAYERKHAMKFDVCVKWRLDMFVSKPLVFANIPTSGSETQMRSMGNPYMQDNPRRDTNPHYEHAYGTPFDDNIVWSFGHEQVFLTKRKNFEVFGSMVFWFGVWDSGGPFAFNSETFFHQMCIQNQLVHWIFLECTNPLFTYGPDHNHMMTVLR